MTTRARRNDWKFAVSRSRITTTARTRPLASSLKICLSALTWPRTWVVTPRGGWPALAMARSISFAARAKSLFPTLAEAMIIHIPFWRSNSPGTVVDCTSATWLRRGRVPVLLLTGIVWISLSEVIAG